MKVDKEFLVKHRFWVGVGGSALLTLIAIFTLVVIVPRKIAAERKTVETEWDKFKKVADVKNTAFIEVAKEEAEREKRKETEVWAKAWKVQEPLFFWPKAFEKEFEFQNGLFAYEITVLAKGAKPSEPAAAEGEAKKDEGEAKQPDAKAEDGKGEGAKAEPKKKAELVESAIGHFDGKLIGFDAEYILVAGKNPKDGVKKFHRIPGVKVVLPEGAAEPAAEKAAEKAPEKEAEKGAEKGADKGAEKGAEKGGEKGADKGADKEKEADKGADKTPDQGTDKKEKEKARFANLEKYADEDPAKAPYVTVLYFKSRRFNDPLTDREQVRYAETYKTQLLPVLKEAGPLNELGQPVVGFAGWSYGKGTGLPPANSKFFRYVVNENGRPEWKTADLDISEEAWIAQEDLWIQAELFRRVKAANDSVANFEPVKGKAGVFKNPYWWVEVLGAEGDKVKLRVTNRLDRPQAVNVTFLVRLQPGGPLYRLQPIKDAAPLAPAGTVDPQSREPRDRLVRELKVMDKEAPPAKQVAGLRQVLTWETAAVRRIDYVTIGAGAGGESAHSHRTVHMGLQPLKKKEVAEKKEETPAPTTGAPGGADMKGKGGSSAGGMPGGLAGLKMPGAAGMAGAAESGLTANGLFETRYVEVTPQARRLPVGIVLIVDQAHVARVQTAFGDSPLRFLVTQVLLNRYPRSVRPDAPSFSNPAGDNVAGGPGVGGMPIGSGGMPMMRPSMASMMGKMMGSQMGMKMSGGSAGGPPARMFGSGGMMGGSSAGMPGYGSPMFGMPGTAYGGASEPVEADEQEANVELVLYGIVTLYERFPPRPPSALPAVEAPPTEPQPAPEAK